MAADDLPIRICQDERAFVEYCLEQGFHVPRVLDLPLKDECYPVFVREPVGKAGRSAFRADSPEELQYILRSLHDPIVQEYVDAPEYTVDVFTDFDGQVVSAVPRLRMTVFGGESFVGKTVDHPEIVRDDSPSGAAGARRVCHRSMFLARGKSEVH